MREYLLPADIERRSFEIIAGEMRRDYDDEIKSVVMRVIHTTADFDYEDNLYFSGGVVAVIKEAIKQGCDIVTDTNMARSGINKKRLAMYGGEVHCFMSDPDIAEAAKRDGTTRAAKSMERAAALGRNCIFAIGNAPTALMKLHELKEAGKINPVAVIAVPVGFVNVVEAKELIVSSDVPNITARGRKGGSNVAAAICNAILYNM